MTNPLGTYIRAAREARGLNQADVATELSVSQSLVSRWEQGKAHPSAHLAKLAALLKVNPAALLERGVGIFDEVELAILRDSKLSRRDQDTLLAAYGVLAGRNSLSSALAFRAGAEHFADEGKND